jgi:hypothetical protein
MTVPLTKLRPTQAELEVRLAALETMVRWMRAWLRLIDKDAADIYGIANEYAQRALNGEEPPPR